MVIYEILDSILIVAIMASCTTSIHQSPDWDWIQFQECALELYYRCLYNNSYECLNGAVKLWFTGKDFKNKHYGEICSEDMNQRFFSGWRRPPRICNNIGLLKKVNKWMMNKEAEHGIPHIILKTDEDMKRAKELIPTLPDELKPLNVIRRIRSLPGWIKMDSPKMRKEVVYFMTHLSRTGWGENSSYRVRELYNLNQYMPWHISEHIYDSLSEKDKMGFYDYCKDLSTTDSRSKVSIIDSIMGSTESVA